MVTSAEAKPGRTGRWLTLGRSLWVVLAVGYLVLWLASLPGFYERVSTLTIEPVFFGARVTFDNDIAHQQASVRGLSLPMYAIYEIAYVALSLLIYYVTAAMILWRTSSRFGWFTALVLTLVCVPAMELAVRVADLFPAASLLVLLPSYLIWTFWALWLCLFPNGRIEPRWARLPITIYFAAFLVMQLASFLAVVDFVPAWIDTLEAKWGPLLTMPLFGLILVAHIYRYRQLSTPIERQQTKWFLFAVGVLFAWLVLFSSLRSYYTVTYAQEFSAAVGLVFPFSVAIAVLRYRLWDIDVIIRRTLIYSVLTALLALIYLGSIVVLQALLRPLVGADAELATVASTLAIGALFQPLRRRIQAVIDRRFYRRKYDAARTLDAFSGRLRNETDLQMLTSDMMNVVEETLQPAHVSLWLRDLQGDG